MPLGSLFYCPRPLYLYTYRVIKIAIGTQGKRKPIYEWTYISNLRVRNTVDFFSRKVARRKFYDPPVYYWHCRHYRLFVYDHYYCYFFYFVVLSCAQCVSGANHDAACARRLRPPARTPATAAIIRHVAPPLGTSCRRGSARTISRRIGGDLKSVPVVNNGGHTHAGRGSSRSH